MLHRLKLELVEILIKSAIDLEYILYWGPTPLFLWSLCWHSCPSRLWQFFIKNFRYFVLKRSDEIYHLLHKCIQTMVSMIRNKGVFCAAIAFVTSYDSVRIDTVTKLVRANTVGVWLPIGLNNHILWKIGHRFAKKLQASFQLA